MDNTNINSNWPWYNDDGGDRDGDVDNSPTTTQPEDVDNSPTTTQPGDAVSREETQEKNEKINDILEGETKAQVK